MNGYFIRGVFFCLSLLLIFSGCYYFSSDIEFPQGDFSILSANLLGNNNKKSEVTKALLNQDCTVMVLVEARPDLNFIQADIQSAGYELYFFESNWSGFNIMIASKLTGLVTQHDNFTQDATSVNPINFLFGELRLSLGGSNIIILGTHMPSPYSFERSNQDLIFNKLASLFEVLDGKIIEGSGPEVISYPIICGDINAFPQESYFQEFEKQGLIDSFVKNPDPYDYTWGFNGELVLARIDYIFVSQYFSILRQSTFELPGSDHRGVKTALNLPEL